MLFSGFSSPLTICCDWLLAVSMGITSVGEHLSETTYRKLNGHVNDDIILTWTVKDVTSTHLKLNFLKSFRYRVSVPIKHLWEIVYSVSYGQVKTGQTASMGQIPTTYSCFYWKFHRISYSFVQTCTALWEWRRQCAVCPVVEISSQAQLFLVITMTQPEETAP